MNILRKKNPENLQKYFSFLQVVADLVASGIVPLLAKFHLFGKAACADEEAGKKKKIPPSIQTMY